ncbi:tetratricopeptide repeat protein [Nocardia sp. NPDC003482]
MEPRSGTGGRDWAEIAQEYLAGGDDTQAHRAAQEATNQRPDDPVAWHLRAQASLSLGRQADALFEVNEAVRLSPYVAEFHATLGDVRCAEQDWPRAREAYSRARELDPANPAYAVGVATTLVDDLDTAVALCEEAVREHPSNTYFRECLVAALADSITEGWSELADGDRAITNAAQLRHARERLARIATVDLSEPEFEEVRAHLDEIRRITDRAERVRWYGSDHMAAYLGGMAVAVVAFLIGTGSGSGGLAFLAVLVGVGIAAVYVGRHRMAGWRWTRRHVTDSVRRTGLQDGSG